MPSTIAIVFVVCFSLTPAICTHGIDVGTPTGSPFASQPSNRTGPHNSASDNAAMIGDFPQPFMRRSTARDHTNRPRSFTAYR
jgi:hypothetical protein